MKFYGEPNLTVTAKQNNTVKIVCVFDENGEFKTDREKIIKILKRNGYKFEDNMHKCRYCDFKTENKGQLMAHYKTHKEV